MMSDALDRLRYLRHGLAAVLLFTGATMIGSEWVHISPGVSVGIIGLVLRETIAVSKWPRRIRETVPLEGEKKRRKGVAHDRSPGSVIAAYGGVDRGRTVRAIDVTFNFSGRLLDLEGYPGHRRPSASVDAAKPRTVVQWLGDASDERSIFTPSLLWIERRDGTSVEEQWTPKRASCIPIRVSTPPRWDGCHE